MKHGTFITKDGGNTITGVVQWDSADEWSIIIDGARLGYILCKSEWNFTPDAPTFPVGTVVSIEGLETLVKTGVGWVGIGHSHGTWRTATDESMATDIEHGVATLLTPVTD